MTRSIDRMTPELSQLLARRRNAQALVSSKSRISFSTISKDWFSIIYLYFFVSLAPHHYTFPSVSHLISHFLVPASTTPPPSISIYPGSCVVCFVYLHEDQPCCETLSSKRHKSVLESCGKLSNRVEHYFAGRTTTLRVLATHSLLNLCGEASPAGSMRRLAKLQLEEERCFKRLWLSSKLASALYSLSARGRWEKSTYILLPPWRRTDPGYCMSAGESQAGQIARKSTEETTAGGRHRQKQQKSENISTSTCRVSMGTTALSQRFHGNNLTHVYVRIRVHAAARMHVNVTMTHAKIRLQLAGPRNKQAKKNILGRIDRPTEEKCCSSVQERLFEENNLAQTVALRKQNGNRCVHVFVNHAPPGVMHDPACWKLLKKKFLQVLPRNLAFS